MENNIFDKKNFYLYRKHEEIPFDEFVKNIPKDFNGIIFKTIDSDSIGRSNGNPRWGKVFDYEDGKITEKGIAIYKEPDYDALDGAYAEKLWSILGKLVLPNCRIPNIDIINDTRHFGDPGILSYSIVDKQKEDMVDIRTILRYNGITIDEMKKNDDRLYIEELLGYIKNFMGDGDNYKEIEENIVKTILLDCITNSFDRHPDNWALVSDSKTQNYQLGLYDNAISFVNIIDYKPGVVTQENWGLGFMRVKTKQGKVSYSCKDIVDYIHEQYPEYYKQFLEDLNVNLDKFYTAIHQTKYENSIRKELNSKLKYLKSLDKDLERDF